MEKTHRGALDTRLLIGYGMDIAARLAALAGCQPRPGTFAREHGTARPNEWRWPRESHPGGSMGAGSIRVTPDQLTQVSSQLSSGAANIENILQQLKSQVAPLGSEWASAAQVQFMELWQQWQNDGMGLFNALTQMSQLMNQAAERYRETDQANAGGFRAF
jgi:WXG100 family type VII secretion target